MPRVEDWLHCASKTNQHFLAKIRNCRQVWKGQLWHKRLDVHGVGLLCAVTPSIDRLLLIRLPADEHTHMALDAADALFMDELFADLDASHFSIPPSQSPPKKKQAVFPASSQHRIASPKASATLSRSAITRARSPLRESTAFQSQPTLDQDFEDWFQRSPDPSASKSASTREPFGFQSETAEDRARY